MINVSTERSLKQCITSLANMSREHSGLTFVIHIDDSNLSTSPCVTIYRRVDREVQMVEYLIDKSLGDSMFVHKELPKLFSEINDDLNKSTKTKVIL